MRNGLKAVPLDAALNSLMLMAEAPDAFIYTYRRPRAG